MTTPVCIMGCGEQPIVQHESTGSKLCLAHAAGVQCRCGHPAHRCPVIGCGDWMAVSASADSLLLFDFQLSANPEQYPTH